MIFVDMRNPKPLYEQIKESVRSQVVRGVLQPEDKLPSVRELAQSAAINPNTIQRAYRDLEAEGLIYSAPGRGYFVREPGPELREKRKRELLEKLEPILAELKYLGVTQEELQRRMKGGTNT